MANIKIDGKELQVADGITILEAADIAGIEIPHFCYHKELSIRGSCRMCLVEVEKMPKLVPACSTTIKDEMNIFTSSERVIKNRRGVLEFFLINHPLDCPICDQAGECTLQDYVYKYGSAVSRFTEEKEHFERRKELGPHVLHYTERCVLCGRCIRFCEEISETRELARFNRSFRSEVDVFPGKRLDNKLSGNVVDLCPVGAMVSKEFLFKSRVWWLTHTESICPLCSRGCNIEIDSRDNKILRVRPRPNPEVNIQWMCDDGRFGWDFVQREDRLTSPLKREGAEMVSISRTQAINLVKGRLSYIISNFGKEAVAAIASPYLTNEDNYLLRILLLSVIGSPYLAVCQPPQVEERMVFPSGFTIEADKSPNLAGAQDVSAVEGRELISHRQLLQKVASGEVRALYFLGGAPRMSLPVEEREMLRKVDFLVVHDYAPSELTEWAELVLPNLSFAEREGTFTNFQGRVQRLRPALLPPGEAKPDWEILQEVCQAMGGEVNYPSAEKVFEEIVGAVPGYKSLSYKDLGNQGKAKG